MAAEPIPGQIMERKGCVARLIGVINQSAAELEQRIGYNPGRLRAGWALLFLKEHVTGRDFRFAGYTHLSGGRIGHPIHGDTRPSVHDHLQGMLANPADFANNFARDKMPVTGIERIVKIIPLSDQDPALSDAESYPPGSGIPQWIMTTPKKFLVGAVVKPGMSYLCDGSVRPIGANGFWIDPHMAKTI